MLLGEWRCVVGGSVGRGVCGGRECGERGVWWEWGERGVWWEGVWGELEGSEYTFFNSITGA